MGVIGRNQLNRLYCSGKRAYPTDWQAKDAAERHLSCFRCLQGHRMGAFRCTADPSHFHLGHERT